MSSISGYVVVTADGKLKRPRRSAPSIFVKLGVATGKANREGDAVVAVTVDLDKPPVFIRSKVL